MSSNCPPQLQLSIQPSTTNFKRSFEQFGFDLESPVGASDAGSSGSNNGNDRNKRARSSSSFSEGSDSTDGSRSSSSTLASGSESGSSLMSLSRGEPTRAGGIASSDLLSRPIVVLTPELSTRASLDPPRLPTPMIQDIDMTDYTPVQEENTAFSANLAAQNQVQQRASEDRYRLSLERFNAFESEISVLRRSQPPSPAVARSPTPPPTLPPLSISSNRARISASDLAFFHPSPRPSTPLFVAGETFFHLESPSSTQAQSPTTIRDNSFHEEPRQEQDNSDEAPISSIPNAHLRFRTPLALSSGPRMDFHPASSSRQSSLNRRTSNELEAVNVFRQRLNTALDRLRPTSPLVPGLGDGDNTADEEEAQEPYASIVSLGDEELDDEEDDDDEDDEDEDEDEGDVDDEVDDEDDDEDDEEAEDDEEENVRSLLNQVLPPNPPTLPPIPPITAGAEGGWSDSVSFLGDNDVVPATDPARSSAAWHAFNSTLRSQIMNPNLRDHPLPSPLLRDLHSWMEGRRHGNTSPSNEAGGMLDPTSDSTDARQRQQQTSTAQSSTDSQSARDADWSFYESMFDPFTSSSMLSAAASSAAATGSGSTPAAGSSRPSGYSGAPGMSTTPASSSSSSDLFGNPVSVPYSRNVADEAAVRSLDHGIGTGLGFGSAGSAFRPSVHRPPSRLHPGMDGHGQTIAASSSSIPSARNPSTGAAAGGSGDSSRTYQSFSGHEWQYSHVDGNESTPSTDLELGFSSLAGHAGSPSSPSSQQQASRVDPLPSIPSPGFTSQPFEHLFSPPLDPFTQFSRTTGPSSPALPSWMDSTSTHQTTDSNTFTPTSTYPAANSHTPQEAPSFAHWPWTAYPDPSGSEPASRPTASTSTATSTSMQPRDVAQPFYVRQRLRSSTSLAAENAAEVRRREDYAEIDRSRRVHFRAPEAEDSTGRDSTDNNGSNGAGFGGQRLRQTLDEFITDSERRLRAFPGGAEILQSIPPRNSYRPADPPSSSSTTRDSPLDSAITGRRGRWGMPMPTTTSTPGTITVDTTGDVVMLSLTDFGGNPLSLQLPAIVNPAIADSGHRASESTAPRVEQTTGSNAAFSWFDLPASSQTSRAEDQTNTMTTTPPTTTNSSPTSPSFSAYPPTRRVYEVQNRSNDQMHSLSGSGPTYHSGVPSLPPPDLGGTFDAEGPAQTFTPANTSSLQSDTRSHFARRFSELVNDRGFRGTFDQSHFDPTTHTNPLQRQAESTIQRNRMVASEASFQRPEPTPQATARTTEEMPSHDRLRRLMDERNRSPWAVENNRPPPPSQYVRPPSSVGVPFPMPSEETRWLEGGESSRPRQPSTFSENVRTLEQQRARLAELAESLETHRRPQYRPINPETFTAGPFRNTMQHHLERQNSLRRRNVAQPPPASNPPTIPPLSLGENITSLRNTLQDQVSRSSAASSHSGSSASSVATDSSSSSHQSVEGPPRRDTRFVRALDRPTALQPRTFPRTSFASARAAALNTNNENGRSNPGGRADVHDFISRQIRMEGSRVEDPTAPLPGAGPGRSMIEPLRPDGRNLARQRQLIQQFQNHHRDADGSAAPSLPARHNRYSGFGMDVDNPDTTRREASETENDSIREGTLAHTMRGRRGRYPRGNAELLSFGTRRIRALGDFVRDEDFDESYESLLTLAQTLGDVKPRSTPSEIIEKMEKGLYKDWATPDSDQRCPICLDDYEPTDPVLKLNNCSHWLHQDCLNQWLTTASTCPVCRKSVHATTAAPIRRVPLHHHHHYHHVQHPPQLQRIFGNPFRRPPTSLTREPSLPGAAPGPSSGTGPRPGPGDSGSGNGNGNGSGGTSFGNRGTQGNNGTNGNSGNSSAPWHR